MKTLFLLIPCLFILSCEQKPYDGPYRGDKIRVKNTEVIGTVTTGGDYVYFYYEDDFGVLHFESLRSDRVEKVIDNP
jgi:hypothetical protein